MNLRATRNWMTPGKKSLNPHHGRKRERGKKGGREGEERNRKNEDAARRVEMRRDSSHTFTRNRTKERCNARALAKMTEWPEKICARR